MKIAKATESLLALVVLSITLQAHAQTCENSPAPWLGSEAVNWEAVTAPDGNFLTDIPGDALGVFDAVGGSTDADEAAAFLAYSDDENTLYFRVRLAESPASESANKWDSFGFHTLLESDGNTSDGSWDFNIVMNGVSSELWLGRNDVVSAENDWCGDSADFVPCTFPATVDNSGDERFPGYARVTPACSSFGSADSCELAACQSDLNADGLWDGHPSCSDRFLELQIPAFDLEVFAGVVDVAVIPVVMGTSSNSSEINKDVLGAACADDWDTVAGQSYLCEADQFVSGGSCVSCPPLTSNEAGDDTRGPDTWCDRWVIQISGFEDLVCALEADCSYFDLAPTCDPSTCQGEGTRGACTDQTCLAVPWENDTVCTSETLAIDCGPYPDEYCTGEIDQDAPACASSCQTDDDCKAGAHCADNACVADVGIGGFCDMPGQCADGFHCVDNVCCTSPCTGLCEACDLAGLEGSCNAVPSGLDPDNECDGFSCSGYFWGWSGDTCYVSAAANDQAVACSGSGRCETPSTVCLLSGQGDAFLTCEEGFEPDLSTCSGTTAPQCTEAFPPGVACELTEQCADGLSCVDGVCCTSVCSGLCEACDLSGQEGSCAAIPAGEDPAEECPELACTEYFWGWSDNTCYRQAPAPGSCDGARSCEDAATACLLTGQGSAELTCEVGYTPDQDSCSGTAAPICEPVPGSIAGTVWLDQNGDGVRQGGPDVGLSGVVIELFADEDENGLPDGTPLANTETDGSGAYVLGGVLGSYVLQATYSPEFCLSSGPDSYGDPGTGYTFTVSVEPGENVSGIDIGLTDNGCF